MSRFTAHAIRLTFHGSRITAHVSRNTPHVSRNTFHAIRFTLHSIHSNANIDNCHFKISGKYTEKTLSATTTERDTETESPGFWAVTVTRCVPVIAH